MNIIQSKEKKISIDKNAILVYCIMFFSNDTYLFGTNSNSFIITFSRYLLILICTLLLIKMGLKINIKKNKVKLLAYFVVVIVYSCIAFVNHELFNRVIIKLLCITVAVLMCMLLSFDEYVAAFRKAMVFIAVTAIMFTLLAYVLPSVVRMFPYIVNTANTKIYTCGFAGLLDGVINQFAIRTQGIFWEPGVFQMYLNMAIAYELLYRKSADRKNLLVYFIALFLTFSTTGFVVAAWVLACYALFKKSETGSVKTNETKKFLMVFSVFILAMGILQFTEIGEVVFGKIINPTSSGTAMVRKAGVVTNIEIALLNPIHGIGMERMGEEFLRLSMASKYILGWTEQNTNTLLYQFAAHGIPYGMLFTIGTFKFGNCFAKGKRILTWSVFIMLVLMYVGENLQYSSLPYIFIFYGYGWKEEMRAIEHKYISGLGS